MSGIRKILVTASAIFLSAMAAKGQTSSVDGVVKMLQEEGFEDIRTHVANDTLFASIEDRTYRGTFRGAATAIKSISERHPEIQQFEILLTEYKTPQLIVHASKRGGIWDVRVDREMQKARKRLKAETPQAKSSGKIDITLFPRISLVNNKLDHLFDYNVRLAPAIAATLWKGARLTIQPIIPYLNNLKEYDSGRRIQIGQTNIRQQVLSTKRWTMSAAVGFFNIERVGGFAEVGYHAMRGLDLYIKGGYTASSTNSKEDRFGIVRNSEKLDFMARADYYEPYTKLQIQLQGGRFLYGDYGGRLDVTRHFCEYAIGAYAILTEGEHNFGFHFAIPFGGKKQKQRGFVRFRLPEYFAMEYFMESNPKSKYYSQNMGDYYTTQPDDNRSAHFWEPAFIQEYVTRILNGTFQ